MKNTFKKSALLTLLFTCLSSYGQKYILDSDTGNEIDDLYAIVYAIAEPDMELISLNSAHFNNVQMVIDSSWSGNKVSNFVTVQESQKLNEELLKTMDRLDIPHPMGCKNHIGYAWGYYKGATIPESPATDFIISEAKKASPDNKLKVICIGASTNLAAAIQKDSTITKNIHAFLLGARFDKETNVWNKSEFNIQRDLNAFDVLLNEPDLELTVMPITTARPYTFNKDRTLKKLSTYKATATDKLAERWTYMNAGDERVMWDLALVVAIQKPELATLETRPAPPENKRKSLKVYTQIEVEKMHKEFWDTLDAYFSK
ncbi:nucleoside hydrolase [Galbibacter sp. BG1]|uniref:nucleoside hydrolase n=1 Tax=Galbibacter sp. BG1 TaxID=1170699 RepID=UPI0015BE9A91|nr:nucleoside hydrolase [Galbibacter sp. BG1]QLE02209.1 nucleoside hydrolase [Galbibacter sp. BG1]